MAVDQSHGCRLTLRHREQAPSHIWITYTFGSSQGSRLCTASMHHEPASGMDPTPETYASLKKN
ncbi:hypothetical protein LRQ20_32080, partial [Pseudomonas sp. MAFF 311096]